MAAPQRHVEMHFCAALHEFVKTRTDVGTLLFSCVACSIYFVEVNIADFMCRTRLITQAYRKERRQIKEAADYPLMSFELRFDFLYHC